MDTKSLQQSNPRKKTKAATRLAGDAGQAAAPAAAAPDLAVDTASDALWINELGQILDCSGPVEDMFGYWKDELKGQHISVLLPDLTHSSFLQCSSPSTVWLDNQGQIQDCSGPIEDMFGYWKEDLKGQHISMLLPDLAHAGLLEKNGDKFPLLSGPSCDAIAFGSVTAQRESASSVLLSLVSTQAGRELTVILRSQFH